MGSLQAFIPSPSTCSCLWVLRHWHKSGLFHSYCAQKHPSQVGSLYGLTARLRVDQQNCLLDSSTLGFHHLPLCCLCKKSCHIALNVLEHTRPGWSHHLPAQPLHAGVAGMYHHPRFSLNEFFEVSFVSHKCHLSWMFNSIIFINHFTLRISILPECMFVHHMHSWCPDVRRCCWIPWNGDHASGWSSENRRQFSSRCLRLGVSRPESAPSLVRWLKFLAMS